MLRVPSQPQRACYTLGPAAILVDHFLEVTLDTKLTPCVGLWKCPSLLSYSKSYSPTFIHKPDTLRAIMSKSYLAGVGAGGESIFSLLFCRAFSRCLMAEQEYVKNKVFCAPRHFSHSEEVNDVLMFLLAVSWQLMNSNWMSGAFGNMPVLRYIWPSFR